MSQKETSPTGHPTGYCRKLFIKRQNFSNFTLGKYWKKEYNTKRKLIFKITDEIDDFSVQKIRRRADYEIERYMPKKVIFDFDSVTFMDSAGIGLIIGRYKFVKMLGGTVELANLTSSIKKIFEMSGILRLIPITNLEVS